MSGYRTTGYDPAYEPARKLLRPFDRWQWFGVALAAIGLALSLIDTADLFIRDIRVQLDGGGMLIFAGLILIWWRDADQPAGTLGPRRRIGPFILIAGGALMLAAPLI